MRKGILFPTGHQQRIVNFSSFSQTVYVSYTRKNHVEHRNNSRNRVYPGKQCAQTGRSEFLSSSSRQRLFQNYTSKSRKHLKSLVVEPLFLKEENVYQSSLLKSSKFLASEYMIWHWDRHQEKNITPSSLTAVLLNECPWHSCLQKKSTLLSRITCFLSPRNGTFRIQAFTSHEKCLT